MHPKNGCSGRADVVGGKKRVGRLGKMAAGVLPLLALGATSGVHADAVNPHQEVSSGSYTQSGAVFAMTNVVGHNQIVEYRRSSNGRLDRVGTVATRGSGIGTDLDTQGPLQLSQDHRFLYAVNAGSDNVSVFAVHGAKLIFLEKVYAGDEPNSLTLHGNLLYVLDGSVAGNGVRGFRVAANGTLTAISHSFRLLSSPIAVPGDVQFSPDGRLLFVTEKTTNVLLSPQSAIDVFHIRDNGLASAVPERAASHGVRPFSMAFRNDGELVVAESFNAAPGRAAVSSYRVSASGDLMVRSGSVRNYQTDTCWIVVTNDGRYAFTANFGSGTISSYRFTSAGRVRLIDGKAAFLGALSQPVDLGLSDNGRYLYLLLRGTGGVAAFAIGDGGHLKPLGVVKGALPVADGASGLAAY